MVGGLFLFLITQREPLFFCYWDTRNKTTYLIIQKRACVPPPPPPCARDYSTSLTKQRECSKTQDLKTRQGSFSAVVSENSGEKLEFDCEIKNISLSCSSTPRGCFSSPSVSLIINSFLLLVQC